MVVARGEVDTSSDASIGSPGPGTSSELLYRMFVKKDANMRASSGSGV